MYMFNINQIVIKNMMIANVINNSVVKRHIKEK